VTLHALGIGSVEWQSGEELGRHATAPAGVVGRTVAARPTRAGLAQVVEQRGARPDLGEAPVDAQVAGLELVMDGERAGVHVAHGVDQTHHPAGTAQVQSGQRFAQAGEVEEGVARQHLLAAGQQPLVQLSLLRRGGMKFVPHVGAPPGRSQPGQPELRPVPFGDRLEAVELRDVLSRADDRQLEALGACRCEMRHGFDGGGVGALTPHRVVDLGGCPVEGDLDVDVAVGRHPLGRLGGDPGAVGRELHAHVVRGGVVEELPEVGSDRGLTAPDVDVEDLHPFELVDDGLGLIGVQLVRVSPARARQAVPACQVAGVGELPGDADRRIQAPGQVIDQRSHGRRLIMAVSASRCRALS
jgi:hypothetical protein